MEQIVLMGNIIAALGSVMYQLVVQHPLAVGVVFAVCVLLAAVTGPANR
jgi:hypothetical protein